MATFGLAVAVVLSLAGEIDWKKRMVEFERLAPAEAVSRAELWLADDPPEASRRTLLLAIVDAAEKLAPELTAGEREWIERTRPIATPFTQVLKSRFALILANDTFASRAAEGKLLGTIDAAYALQRALFDVDPVAERGRRILFFCEKGRPGPWMANSDIPRIHMPEGYADDGRWCHQIAHELNHPFGHVHPARELFGGGLFEGWADLMHAFTAEQMGCIEPILANTFPGWRDELLRCGRVEYLDTRLPIEEIVSYGPSSSLLLRLALAAGDGATPNWATWRAAFRETKTQPRIAHGFWPERFAADVRAAFGDAVALPILAEYRFPVDRAAAAELARRVEFANRPRTERWALLGEEVVRDLQVLGPLADREGRHVDFDPFDAENFTERDEHALGDARFEWRRDVAVDDDGVLRLSNLPGGDGCAVFYVRGTLPNRAAGRATLFVASDDDVSVWIDGEFVHAFRGSRGVDVDSPDRVAVALARPNAEVLALVANYGGPGGLALRLQARDPFAGAAEELRSGDEARALAAAGWIATRRSSPASRVEGLADAASHRFASVREVAARGLGGLRNSERAVEALIDRLGREREPRIVAALRSSLPELCFVDFADFHAARDGWRELRADWKLADFAEAELVYSQSRIFGGWYGNSAGAFGGQCIDRGWGSDPAHRFGIALNVRRAGPTTLKLRYAVGEPGGSMLVRLRRGETIVAERSNVRLPPTADGSTWSWLDLDLGDVPAARYRVEFLSPTGAPQIDIVGLAPARTR